MSRKKNIKIAVLSINLAGLAAGEPIRFLPMGNFMPNDGRDLPCGQWNLSATTAVRIAEHWNNRPEQMPIDYEHQTQKAEVNGKPAPAAGWAVTGSFEVRADGVFALPSYTKRGKQYIDEEEYKYLSPVFTYDERTGEVLMLHMAALTNTPGLTGLTDLNPATLKCFLNQSFEKESDVNEELLKLLGLGDGATEEEVSAAVAALQAKLQAADEKVATLQADLESRTTEIATLKSSTANGQAGAGAEAIAALQAQVVTLTAQVNGGEVDKLVEQGLSDGRLSAATESWARELGKNDLAQLTAFLDKQPKVDALLRQQTGGMSQTASGEHGLTADELAVCSAMGMSPKDFVVAKAAS